VTPFARAMAAAAPRSRTWPGSAGAQFLSSLAVQGVAASTQNQALSALLFLYRHVLQVELPWLDDVVRAKRSERTWTSPPTRSS
jgi:hypothetical protein